MKSKVKSNYEFDEETWVVSVVNTGDKLPGHAIIVVEGIKLLDERGAKSAFITQYDIQAALFPNEMQDSVLNKKGYIKEIRIFETSRDYKLYQSKSHYALPEKVKDMIASIEADKIICERASKNEPNYEFPSYQLYGEGFFGSKGKGDNCAGWCDKKLALAGIGNGTGKPKPKVVASRCIIL